MEIIKIIGLAVAALCMYAAGFLYIHKKKIRMIYPLKRKEKVFVGITVLVILALSVTLVYGFAETNSFLHNMRLLLLYGIICPIAFIDYYDKIIPNKLLLFSAFVWLITVGIEVFVDSSNVYNDFKSSIIAMAAIFVIGIVCKVLVKNSVGMGDIKLFMIMGLFQGATGMAGAIFISLLVAFFGACGMLLTKRKNRKDTISFGPFILIGTTISMFLTGV